MREAENLEVVGRFGVGVDNIAVDLATELGIAVTYVPDYCVDEVSVSRDGAAVGVEPPHRDIQQRREVRGLGQPEAGHADAPAARQEARHRRVRPHRALRVCEGEGIRHGGAGV